MTEIDNLLKQVSDPVLRKRLEEEIERISRKKKFGLVFEDHIPECTRLYGIAVKQGSLVTRRTDTRIEEIWQVVQIEGEEAVCCKKGETTAVRMPINDLVAVAQFGEPIYPYLESVDAVCNAPDSNLWHTLIEAENYHALQLLEYLYAGQVDCIYIDPPYNTGARDWKYNNDYVDNSDSYRHSKWLSMMKKRLELAKKLLNPADSVLIVTIDEKEYLHLGCLLEEMFPEATIQMVSSVINPKGTARSNEFSRVNEFIYFVMIGNYKIAKTGNDMLTQNVSADTSVRWRGFPRTGRKGLRPVNPGSWYPIYFNKEDDSFHSVGDAIYENDSIPPAPEGTYAIWPPVRNGEEYSWAMVPSTFRKLYEIGAIKFGKSIKGKGASISYLTNNQLDQIKKGVIEVKGRDDNGTLIVAYSNDAKTTAPKTQWNVTAHEAGAYGTNIIGAIIPGRRFSFPKSLYAVHDAIRFFVANKPNALILDFFAGSGTTLHAVNLLNAEDGGHRRCIMVTNNEVSSEEEKMLRSQGWQPGDEAWEQYGIARYVTWPRTVCSIEGHDINGHPLKGNYLGSDRPMADGFAANCEYFKLGFMDKTRVSLGAQFREILPLLWLKTGAVGRRPELTEDEVPDMMILTENGFAVLIDETQFASFARALRDTDIDKVFFVTNSESAFREMSEAVEAKQTWQLYRDYIDNFTIGARRAVQ